MTKQNTSNSSYLAEKVTPHILSLGTKPIERVRAGREFVSSVLYAELC